MVDHSYLFLLFTMLAFFTPLLLFGTSLTFINNVMYVRVVIIGLSMPPIKHGQSSINNEI